MPQIQATVTKPRRAPQRAAAGTSIRTRESQQEQVVEASEVDPQLQLRFWNFIVPAVTSMLPTFAPKVGGAIGGLFGKKGHAVGSSLGGMLGGVFGKRDAVALPDDAMFVEAHLNNAVQEQQLAQTVLQLTQQCTPAIIDILTQTVEDHTARGGGADVDDQTMEGSWGLLASVITEQCIAAAPDAIKTATKVMNGGIVGARDLDEEPLLIVDTEINQRFVLPALSAILSGVQQVLPQLLSLVSGDRAIPRDVGISWQDLEATKRFWDNDNISVKSISPIDNPDEIEIVLELAPHKTWWKGIEIQDGSGGFVTEIGVENDTKVAAARVPAQLLLSPGGYLIFRKAKWMGVHTGMYRLAAGGLEQLRGQQVHFYWYAD